MIRIVAQAIRNRQGWSRSVGLPTFYFDTDTVAAAISMARSMFTDLAPDANINLEAYNQDTGEYLSHSIVR